MKMYAVDRGLHRDMLKNEYLILKCLSDPDNEATII